MPAPEPSASAPSDTADMVGHDPGPRAPRVSQVDADELDDGLVSMLGERLERSLTNFKLSWDAKPEMKLVLKLIIMYFGVFRKGASPGASLQNLKLVSSSRPSQIPTRRILLLYLLLHPPVVPQYLMTRIRQHALSRQWPDLPTHDWRSRAWSALIRAENAGRAVDLLGWLLFLWDGRYPSVVMRALGLRLVPASPHLARMVSYEYMNRQLVWGAFTEFLMFSLPLFPPLPPLLTPSALIQPIKSLMSTTKIDYSSLPPLKPDPHSKQSTAAHSGPFASLPLSTCPICYRRDASVPVPLSAHVSLPAIATDVPDHPASTEGEEVKDTETAVFVPAEADCWGQCVYCYYCIAEELVKHQREVEERGKKMVKIKSGDEPGWSCLRCGGEVRIAERLGRV